MNDPAPILDQFLARVHRKWMIVRAVERIGLCILIASVLAAILAAVLIWRAESGMNVILVCLGAEAHHKMSIRDIFGHPFTDEAPCAGSGYGGGGGLPPYP